MFCVSVCVIPQVSLASLSDWELVWSDEFSGDCLEVSKWHVEDAFLIKNNEEQYYSPSDVTVSDGCLVLCSQKRSWFGYQYTSGLVSTKGKFHLQFGRIEIRARLPYGQGIWPAHWLMNAGNSWPPEIDIMELLGHEPDTVHMSLHYGKWPDNRVLGESFSGDDFSKDFHVFAIEWEKSEIRWYVDDVLRHKTREHIPEEPFYLILNTAVGGDWPGPPDERTMFPQYHKIDYVHVYQKRRPNQVFITKRALHGTISIEPDKPFYFKGEKLKLKAVPDIDYVFSQWNKRLWTLPEANIILQTDSVFEAIFTVDKNPYPVLSHGKPIQSSSVESVSLSPENANDGDMRTRWASEFKDDQWLIIDLCSPQKITGLRLYWETAYARSYDIYISKEGVHYQKVYGTDKNHDKLNQIQLKPEIARFVKLKCHKRATEWGFSLFEVQVLGQKNTE